MIISHSKLSGIRSHVLIANSTESFQLGLIPCLERFQIEPKALLPCSLLKRSDYSGYQDILIRENLECQWDNVKLFFYVFDNVFLLKIQHFKEVIA